MGEDEFWKSFLFHSFLHRSCCNAMSLEESSTDGRKGSTSSSSSSSSATASSKVHPYWHPNNHICPFQCSSASTFQIFSVHVNWKDRSPSVDAANGDLARKSHRKRLSTLTFVYETFCSNDFRNLRLIGKGFSSFHVHILNTFLLLSDLDQKLFTPGRWFICHRNCWSHWQGGAANPGNQTWTETKYQI